MTEQEIKKAVQAHEDAKWTGKHGFLNYKRSNLTLYSFVVNHDEYTDIFEMNLAESIIEQGQSSTLFYDYAMAYFKENGIEIGCMELLHLHKYTHGQNPERYHICFDILMGN